MPAERQDPRLAQVLELARTGVRRVCVIPFGSSATAEATLGADGWASDVEVGVVVRWSGLGRLRRLRRDVQAVGNDAELFWIRPARLRRGSRRNFGPAEPNIPAFDLARCPRRGELPKSALPVKVWEPGELPRSEAIRLVLNRVAEYLEVGTAYSSLKLAVSCGDALLVLQQAYSFGYRNRAAAFEQRSGVLSEPLRSAVSDAYRRKLSGEVGHVPPETLRRLVLAVVSIAADRTVNAADAPLIVRELTASPAPVSAPRHEVAMLQAIRWLRVLRNRRSLHAPRLAVARAKEADVYGALMAVMFEEPESAAGAVGLWRAVCY